MRKQAGSPLERELMDPYGIAIPMAWGTSSGFSGIALAKKKGRKKQSVSGEHCDMLGILLTSATMYRGQQRRRRDPTNRWSIRQSRRLKK